MSDMLQQAQSQRCYSERKLRNQEVYHRYEGRLALGQKSVLVYMQVMTVKKKKKKKVVGLGSYAFRDRFSHISQLSFTYVDLKATIRFWLWLILFFITNTVKLDIDSLETLESRQMKCRILQK